MYDSILVPSDGSEHAVRAAEHARLLARAFDATVHLVSVADVQSAAGLFDAGGVDQRFIDRLVTEGRTSISAVEAVMDETDAVRTALLKGDPAESILDYASEHDVGLIAMGTHGRTGLDRYITGSVTERVVRRAPVPVLTVRATERSEVGEGYDDVLVPTDGSEAAAAAIEHALAIAETNDARVHAVTVIDIGMLSSSPEYNPSEETMADLESRAQAATDVVADQAREAGLTAVTAVREGRPASELLAYVDEHAVDLIAMGTAGRTGPSRYLLGSTTERTIRHADVPVLAVNARERK